MCTPSRQSMLLGSSGSRARYPGSLGYAALRAEQVPALLRWRRCSSVQCFLTSKIIGALFAEQGVSVRVPGGPLHAEQLCTLPAPPNRTEECSWKFAHLGIVPTVARRR